MPVARVVCTWRGGGIYTLVWVTGSGRLICTTALSFWVKLLALQFSHIHMCMVQQETCTNLQPFSVAESEAYGWECHLIWVIFKIWLWLLVWANLRQTKPPKPSLTILITQVIGYPFMHIVPNNPGLITITNVYTTKIFIYSVIATEMSMQLPWLQYNTYLVY